MHVEVVRGESDRIGDRRPPAILHHVVLVHDVLADHAARVAHVQLMRPVAAIDELIAAITEASNLRIQAFEARIGLPEVQKTSNVMAVPLADQLAFGLACLHVSLIHVGRGHVDRESRPAVEIVLVVARCGDLLPTHDLAPSVQRYSWSWEAIAEASPGLRLGPNRLSYFIERNRLRMARR